MTLELISFSLEAARSLYDTLSNFDVNTLEEKQTSLHSIEHLADLKKHEIIKKLSREFITPIEREDILNLTHVIDDVTDEIDEVLRRVYMYNISSIRPEAIELADVIVKCCEGLLQISKNFSNFKKSSAIHNHIVEVNGFESLGDKIYTDAMCRLFRTTDNPVEIIVWRDMFEALEGCCDSCENVCDVIESVIMKNI